MHIAVVGPTHPHTGGIVHHTTELSHQLAAAGHEVALVSWSAQYPAFLHPGTVRVPGGEPEVRLFPRTSYWLAWWNPISWWRAGVKLRSFEAVLLVHASTAQVPAYLTMLRSLRRLKSGGAAVPRVVVLAHNVMAHERHRGDEALVRAMFARAEAVLVHSAELADLARRVVDNRVDVVVAEIPPHLPALPPSRHAVEADEQPFNRLLFFGTVRPYKGLDVLLHALVGVPDVRLVVAGDIWSGAGGLRDQISQLGLRDRVTLRPSYVPGSQIAELFRDVDALVLPYRAGTASQNVLLAHAMGVPVIATRTGTLAGQVNDGVDGLLADPSDVDDLRSALQRFYEPGTPLRLRSAVPVIDYESSWQQYIETLSATLAGVAVAGTRASR
jgi:glycosyltransferase involved in cell wall biosynthesis